MLFHLSEKAPMENSGIPYADLVVIVLTGVAVLVTVLGVMIALLSILGWENMKKSALETARLQAETQVKNLIKEGAFNDLIKKAIEELAYSIQGYDDEEEADTPPKVTSHTAARPPARSKAGKR